MATNMNNSSSDNLAVRLAMACKADPKKSGTLAILAILFVAMMAKQILSGNKPRAAGAAMLTQPSNITATAMKHKSDGHSSSRSTGVSAAMLKWADGGVPPVSRNLFAVRMEYFPADGSRTTQSGPADEGFWSRLEKSMAIQADQKDKQENLRNNFKTQAAQLRLESTLPGAQPRAMVNGELVAEGSVVAGFRVLRIEARRITIEREGIQLEIQMKN